MGLKLDEIIKDINKKAKSELISKGVSTYDYEKIPFTSPRMNYMTFGGITEGRLVEFYGENQSGKTTTALDVVANFQNKYPDREVLYVDIEHTFDAVWATKIGVNVDRVYLVEPENQSAEELFEIICKAVDTGDVGLWVIDSIGALQSQQEFDKEIGERTYGGVSMALTRFVKKIDQLHHKHNCTGIGINQTREDLNSQWGGTTTPGGKAWKFMCTIRIEFKMGKFFDDKGNELTRSAENPAGNFIMASVVKNKTAPPSRRIGQYRIRYDSGIDYFADLIDVAMLYNIVDKRGAWYSIIDIETGEVLRDKMQGIQSVYDVFNDDLELLQRVEDMIADKERDE